MFIEIDCCSYECSSRWFDVLEWLWICMKSKSTVDKFLWLIWFRNCRRCLLESRDSQCRNYGNQLHTRLRLGITRCESEPHSRPLTAPAETTVASPVATRNQTMMNRDHHYDSQPAVATRNLRLWLVTGPWQTETIGCDSRSPVASRDHHLHAHCWAFTVTGPIYWAQWFDLWAVYQWTCMYLLFGPIENLDCFIIGLLISLGRVLLDLDKWITHAMSYLLTCVHVCHDYTWLLYTCYTRTWLV